MRFALQLAHTTTQRLEASADLLREKEYWTEYITDPKAMAPTVVRLKGITGQDYSREGRRYHRRDREFTLPYLKDLQKYHGPNLAHKTWYHFGCGHGDDSGYIADALVMGFSVEIQDIVEPAFKRTARRIKNTYSRKSLAGVELPDPRSLMTLADWKETIASSNFNPNTVVGCKVGRLQYHYDREKFGQIFRNLGSLLEEKGTRIILIHHLPELNLGYEYKTSFPYTLADILKPLREVAGPLVEVLNGSSIGELKKDTMHYFSYQYLTWLAIGRV